MNLGSAYGCFLKSIFGFVFFIFPKLLLINSKISQTDNPLEIIIPSKKKE